MKYYLIGSKLLGLNNCHDIDVMTISNEYEYKREKKDNMEIFHRSEDNLLKFMRFQEDVFRYSSLLLSNYQYDQNIIGQSFPIKYNILDYKKELIDTLETIINHKLENFNPRITFNEKCCSKAIYHIAYNIFILQNNDPIINKKQKEIIQKIHDYEMPIEYLEELKQIFNEIKKEVANNEKNNPKTSN